MGQDQVDDKPPPPLDSPGEQSLERPKARSQPRQIVRDIEREAGKAPGSAVRAYKKFNNDWTMNLTVMVAYNLLTSFIPLVLAVITLLAIIPTASGNTQDFAAQINKILPANVSQNLNIDSLLTNVSKAGGLLGLISIIGLVWAGMNLFGAIESAFAVIFRVKTRDFVHQKLMCFVMILFFVVLLPLSFVSSLVVSSATTTLGTIMPSGAGGPAGLVIGFATDFVSLFVLFLAIYIVVPNLPITWRFAWRGALVAALTMCIVNSAFPFYSAHFVGTKQYGAAAIGTAIISIIWFWLFSLVLLVGAQVNALTMEIGPWPHDLSRMLTLVKLPTETGERTGMDAVRDEDDAREKGSPFGVAHDAQQS